MSYVFSVRAKASEGARAGERSGGDLSYGCLEGTEGAEVTAHLLDNTQVQGKVSSWCRDVRGIELADDGDGRRLDFAQVRLLAFQVAITRDQCSAQLGRGWDELSLTADLQPFAIQFNDRRRMSGKMSGLIEDEAGLHILRLQGDGALRRLFVPADNIARHDIGAGDTPGRALERPAGHDAPTATTKKPTAEKTIADCLAEVTAATPEQVARALRKQHDVPNLRLGDLLVHDGAISQEQLDTALAAQHRDRGKRLSCILREMQIVTEESLLLTLARRLGMPFVQLTEFNVQLEALSLIPPDIARKYVSMPLFINGSHLVIAVSDPLDRDTVNLLRFTARRAIELALATEADIRKSLDRHYGPQGNQESLKEIETEALEECDAADDFEAGEIERMGRERPIVRFVQTMIDDAIDKRASDIHIRPEEEYAAMLFRVDGSLVQVRTFSKRLLAAIVSRIKILGGMDVAERRRPQDGQARIKHRDAVIDLRISVLPSIQGESVVFRILDPRAGLRSIDELDFKESDRDAFRDVMSRSQGLFLVTGPTGSGKSTTLYAALNEIRRQNLNVITTEDPVEYHIDGIQQLQVNNDTGYTFACALRHILRHDPDVVMIGEIRDHETADIAMKAAMTGHLVLSTLHTNGAVATVTRLIDMGIDGYLLGPTLIGVLAQRLVRRNCPDCLEEEEVPDYVRHELEVKDKEVFVSGAGCDACHHTGYRGRIAAYELMVLDPTLREMIAAGAPQEELYRQAVKRGMTPLTRHGLALARERTTSLSEAYRVRLH